MGRPNLRKRVAENIKKARLQATMTQEKAAEVTRFHYKYYQRIESGTVNLTLDSIEKIGRAFKVDIQKLVSN